VGSGGQNQLPQKEKFFSRKIWTKWCPGCPNSILGTHFFRPQKVAKKCLYGPGLAKIQKFFSKKKFFFPLKIWKFLENFAIFAKFTIFWTFGEIFVEIENFRKIENFEKKNFFSGKSWKKFLKKIFEKKNFDPKNFFLRFQNFTKSSKNCKFQNFLRN
jgi:hypothetical protein